LREMNNPLPRWWVGLFIITIVFALGLLSAVPWPWQLRRQPGLDLHWAIRG
jgi:cytochrome c oxidase cbb3-type subunit 3